MEPLFVVVLVRFTHDATSVARLVSKLMYTLHTMSYPPPPLVIINYPGRFSLRLLSAFCLLVTPLALLRISDVWWALVRSRCSYSVPYLDYISQSTHREGTSVWVSPTGPLPVPVHSHSDPRKHCKRQVF